MDTYAAFLRGINVSGHRKIKMGELKSSLEHLGLEGVQTYIQSGNMVFKSSIANKTPLEKEIQSQILKDFGSEVPVLVITKDEIAKILENNPFTGSHVEDKNLYFALLHSKPEKEHTLSLNADDYPNEEFSITEKCVYLNCLKGAGKAKLNNNIIERKLKVTATTRNLRTMQNMFKMVS